MLRFYYVNKDDYICICFLLGLFYIVLKIDFDIGLDVVFFII